MQQSSQGICFEGKNKHHLALVGFMGAGKTTVARLIARRCGCDYIDLDQTVETLMGKSVTRIIEASGESCFRELEFDVLRETLAREDACIISCGGGIITHPKVARLLKKHAIVVYLRVEIERALERVGDWTSRPLLTAAGSSDAIARLADSRRPLYEAVADISVDTDELTAEEVADTVVERLKG